MFGKGDKGEDYSMTMIWKKDGIHYKTVKLGEEEDITVFCKVILDNFPYLVVNDDDSNTYDNYLPYVYISLSCLDSALALPGQAQGNQQGPGHHAQGQQYWYVQEACQGPAD